MGLRLPPSCSVKTLKKKVDFPIIWGIKVPSPQWCCSCFFYLFFTQLNRIGNCWQYDTVILVVDFISFQLKQLSPFLLPTLISLTFLVILGNLSRILKEKVEIIQLFQARLVEERARLQQETELFVAVVNNRLTILQNEYKDIMENQLKNQQGDEGINNKYFMQDPEAIHQTNISELRVKLRQLIESTIDLKIQMEEQNRWREVLDDNTYKKNLLARLEGMVLIYSFVL